MVKFLVIVESPSKCKTISKILGPDYRCVATKGHLVELITPKKVSLENIQMNHLSFRILKKQQKNYHNIKKEISNANFVYLATDLDREGECIAWHICRLYDLPINKTPRVRFQEITKEAILDAFRHSDKINMNIVYSALARQWIDYAIGYSISPMLWKYIGSFRLNGLSAGRCQTPALSLLYDKEIELENSKCISVIEVDTTFSLNNIFSYSCKLNHLFETTKENSDFIQSCIDFKSEFVSHQENTVTTKSPLPFTTSTLQQDAARFLYISPKQTMKLAQSLYESGYITYIRTDRPIISSSFLEILKQYIERNYGKKQYCIPEYSKTSKHTQDAHECIRPTDLERDAKKLSSSEFRLYSFILRRTLASCMIPSISKQLSYKLKSPINDVFFKGNIQKIIVKGWREVYKTNTNPEVDCCDIGDVLEPKNRRQEKIHKEQYDYLFNLFSQQSKLDLEANDREKRVTIEFDDIISNLITNEKKQAYSYSNWIKTLDNLGIGRPSTFTSITETVVSRDYARQRDKFGTTKTLNVYHLKNNKPVIDTQTINIGGCKNKVIITPLGRIIHEFINKCFTDLFTYKFTSEMESKLDDIATGKLKWTNVCNYLGEQIKESIKDVNVTPFNFPLTKDYVLFFSRSGIAIQKKTLSTRGKVTWKKYCIIPEKLDYVEDNFGKWWREERWDDCIPCFEELVSTHYIGEYEGHRIQVKKGRYGYYLVLGKQKISVPKDIEQPISLHTAIGIIEKEMEQKSNNTIRMIHNEYPILNGPYGPYLEIKHSKLKKKKVCLSLKTYKGNLDSDSDEMLMQWIYERHKRRIVKDNIAFIFEEYV